MCRSDVREWIYKNRRPLYLDRNENVKRTESLTDLDIYSDDNLRRSVIQSRWFYCPDNNLFSVMISAAVSLDKIKYILPSFVLYLRVK